jgi:hypothetical protein
MRNRPRLERTVRTRSTRVCGVWGYICTVNRCVRVERSVRAHTARGICRVGSFRTLSRRITLRRIEGSIRTRSVRGFLVSTITCGLHSSKKFKSTPCNIRGCSRHPSFKSTRLILVRYSVCDGTRWTIDPRSHLVRDVRTTQGRGWITCACFHARIDIRLEVRCSVHTRCTAVRRVLCNRIRLCLCSSSSTRYGARAPVTPTSLTRDGDDARREVRTRPRFLVPITVETREPWWDLTRCVLPRACLCSGTTRGTRRPPVRIGRRARDPRTNTVPATHAEVSARQRVWRRCRRTRSPGTSWCRHSPRLELVCTTRSITRTPASNAVLDASSSRSERCRRPGTVPTESLTHTCACRCILQVACPLSSCTRRYVLTRRDVDRTRRTRSRTVTIRTGGTRITPSRGPDRGRRTSTKPNESCARCCTLESVSKLQICLMRYTERSRTFQSERSSNRVYTLQNCYDTVLLDTRAVRMALVLEPSPEPHSALAPHSVPEPSPEPHSASHSASHSALARDLGNLFQPHSRTGRWSTISPPRRLQQ